jgi:hypothetical protein
MNWIVSADLPTPMKIKNEKSDALDIGLYLVNGSNGFSLSHSVEQGYTKIVMIFKLKSFLHWECRR